MKCPYCESDNVVTYYKTDMPNILSACPKSIWDRVKTFPFEAQLCMRCLLGFNSTKLDDEELNFIYDNYLYISPIRNIGSTKYTGMIEMLKRYFSKDEKIVEIGCSEGYLLNKLKEEGYKNLTGIEPGPQAAQARKLGLKVINAYFDGKTFPDKTIDGFFLMHVFEHFSDPFFVLRKIKKQLTPAGKVIIEIPYFCGYHHQHLFFYNLTFLSRMCLDNGLKIVDVNMDNKILRVAITHLSDETYKKALIDENSYEIKKFALSLNDKLKDKIAKLNSIFLEHKSVFWWGAGSASVIFLNQIRRDILSKVNLIIVDGDDNKWQKRIPGLGIKVQPFTVLKEKSIDLLIIASELYEEILATIKKNDISAEKIEVFT